MRFEIGLGRVESGRSFRERGRRVVILQKCGNMCVCVCVFLFLS